MKTLERVFGYTDYELNAIENYSAVENDEGNIGFEHNGTFITNPFVEETGRFYLTGEQMIIKYGKENLRKFFEEIMDCICAGLF